MTNNKIGITFMVHSGIPVMPHKVYFLLYVSAVPDGLNKKLRLASFLRIRLFEYDLYLIFRNLSDRNDHLINQLNRQFPDLMLQYFGFEILLAVFKAINNCLFGLQIVCFYLSPQPFNVLVQLLPFFLMLFMFMLQLLPLDGV